MVANSPSISNSQSVKLFTGTTADSIAAGHIEPELDSPRTRGY